MSAAAQPDNPLAAAASLALIMGAIYVLGALSARRRRIARTVRRHPSGGPR